MTLHESLKLAEQMASKAQDDVVKGMLSAAFQVFVRKIYEQGFVIESVLVGKDADVQKTRFLDGKPFWYVELDPEREK